MLLQDKRVAIIGAGPVGLTMAVLLQQKGVDVTVYERDTDAQARIWGGTLDLHKGSGQEAMKKAGLLESYYAMAKPMGRTLADTQGQVLLSKRPVSGEEHEAPEINRNDLRNILLNSLSDNTVVWNRKFTGLETDNEKWVLHFENEMPAGADVVIGANGGLSGVRKYVTDTAVAHTGSFIIQGNVLQPEMNCAAFYQLCEDNILMTAGDGYSLVANPGNNNVLTYNVLFKTPAEWAYEDELNFQDTGSIITFLSDRLSGWHECYQQLFRSTSSFNGLPTRMLPLDRPWKKDRPLPVTLTGDAAHIMPPFAGAGVNTGLMDAYVLSEHLTNGQYDTIAAAISDYERKMFVYAAEAQLATSRNEAMLHSNGFSLLELIR